MNKNKNNKRKKEKEIKNDFNTEDFSKENNKKVFLSIFSNPIQSLQILSILLGKFLKQSILIIFGHLFIIALISFTIFTTFFINGPHTPVY